MPDLSQLPNPAKMWHEYIGEQAPIVKAPIYGGLGYLGGSYGADLTAKLAVKLFFPEKSLQEQQDLEAKIKSSGTVRKLGGLLGALGGVYMATNQQADTKNGIKRLLDSIVDKNYWEKHPEDKEQRLTDMSNVVKDYWYTKQDKPTDIRQQSLRTQDFLTKYSSFGFEDEDEDDFRKDIIPVRHSIDLIHRDNFMQPLQKLKTSSILFGAEHKDTGLTSGEKLAVSAMRAGAGFIPAYAFGKGVGSVLSLPPPVTERLSNAGGIAAAVYNTGIFNKGAFK